MKEDILGEPHIIEISKFSERSLCISNAAGLKKIEQLKDLQYRVYCHAERKKDPSLSLILLVHNTNLNFIRTAVNSVLAQSVNDFELLLVDHGTTGAIKDFLHHTFLNSKNIVLIQTSKNNLDAVIPLWNAGLYAAAGRFSYFMACDDALSSNYVEEVIRIFNKRDDCYTVAPRVQSINDEGQINSEVSRYLDNANERETYVSGQAIIQAIFSGKPIVVAPGGLLVAKIDEVIAKGGYDRVNDLTQYLRFAAKGVSGYAREATLFWRHHAEQTNKQLCKTGLVYFLEYANLDDEFGLSAFYEELGFFLEAVQVRPWLLAHAETTALESIRNSLGNYGVLSGLRAVRQLRREAGGGKLFRKSIRLFFKNLPVRLCVTAYKLCLRVFRKFSLD